MIATENIDGGCSCGDVRYRLTAAPLIVHCCHCTSCQRETGSAFALNAMIESQFVENLKAEPQLQMIPSESGSGQKIARCANCKVAVWSHYSGSCELTKFIRVGTLDNPAQYSPDVHIFTRSKHPWILLEKQSNIFEAYYDSKQVWSEDSLERFSKFKPDIEKARACWKD